MSIEAERGLPNLALVPRAGNDPRPVFEQLLDYTRRGADSPESLSLPEIRQVSFALALYLAIDGENADQLDALADAIWHGPA